MLSLLLDVADLVLPAGCASCGAPGARWCARCRAAVAASCFAGGPRPVAPDPVPDRMPRCWAVAPFAGEVRRLVTAYKDEDRADLRDDLAALLGAAAQVALSRERDLGDRRVVLVPAPSAGRSRRRRGRDPVADLATAVSRSLPGRPPTVRALRLARRTRDQSRLGHDERAANLAGAMRVDERCAAGLAGAAVLLLDDVVTTGATLAEAHVRLAAAGVDVVVAVTIAATARRFPLLAPTGGASVRP